LQLETAGFTTNDLAKYPFLKETAEYIKLLDLQINELTSAGMDPILKRAEERVNEAILYRRITRNIQKTALEISSFPTALLLVAATENSLIKKRYALSEAKQASSDLNLEPKEKVLKVALDFGWKIQLTPKEGGDAPAEFTVQFTDYLKNTSHLRDKKWKLTNSILSSGSIYLNKKDAVRLLEEEIRRRIEKRLEMKLPKYPAEITLAAERIKKLAAETIGQTEMDAMPKVVVQAAFPPCINALYSDAAASHHLSHIGRFTLTSFLVSIGMSAEEVNDMYKTFSDYNERLTRYQIEHIAGERGSGTRYTPPQCSVLQTHGVCRNRDELCRRIYHPLKYYLIKQKEKSPQ
jgi:DNA primase large subunit